MSLDLTTTIHAAPVHDIRDRRIIGIESSKFAWTRETFVRHNILESPSNNTAMQSRRNRTPYSIFLGGFLCFS